MPNFPRTDLAVEAEALRSAAAAAQLPGVRAAQTQRRGFAVTQVEVLDAAGSEALCKPIGRYDTLDLTPLLRRADAAFQRISRRNDPMPGADMLPGGAAVPSTRRSSRHGDAPQEWKAPAAVPGAPEHAPAVQTAAMRPSAAAPATNEATNRRAHRLPGEAAGWSDEVDRLLEDCEPRPRREPIANPFPNIFPGAGFYRVSLPGQSAHLEGDWQRGGERVQITAVPGAYSPRPPAHLPDFTRYIRARSGGYWIRIRPAVRED